MGRYHAYSRTETQWVSDGDPAFTGVNMLIDRGSLPPGMLARSENKRLRDGVAATRPGTTFPGEFNPFFEDIIIGSHIYANPNAEEVMLVATRNQDHVWVLQFGKDPYTVPLQDNPAGPEPPPHYGVQKTGTGLVNFAQAFDKIFLLRTPIIGPPLVWDGTAAGAFKPVNLSTEGLKLIPATTDGVPFQNRLLLFNPNWNTVPWRDQIIMTDVLDYSSYDEVFGTFRINAGESDQITAVVPYFHFGVLVMTVHSLHILQNFTADPIQASQRLVNNVLGSVGSKAPVLVGGDIMFLSWPGGIYRISELIQEQVTTVPVPVSRPIQPLIDRVNWNRARAWATSAQLGDYTYFALPLDDKTGACDAIAVFNNVSGNWESAPDTWDQSAFRINRLLVTLYDGTPRLFGLDYAQSQIYLLYNGLIDEIGSGEFSVQDSMETRGYTFNDPGSFKRTERLVIGMRTYDVMAEITALSDGVNEEKPIATIEKDPLNFYLHGHAPFDPTVDDPNEPLREDYFDAIDNFVIEDFESLPEGPRFNLPGTAYPAFHPNKQQTLERFGVRQGGRWCSIRIENTRGQCDILGVGVDAIDTQQGLRRLA